ncbi:MAG: RHS repeat-associated core domain-containing protein [Bellilinea sp.]
MKTVTSFLVIEITLQGSLLVPTGSGSALASYVLGGTELLSQKRGGATSYYLHDGQGSTRTLTDDSGAVTDTYAYTAFGERYAQTGTTANTYLYTGQKFDSLTGLYSLRARYYDPAVGRFLSQDTANLALMAPGEIDRYVYTANNPINFVDPQGLQAFVEYSEANQTSQEEAAPLGNFSNNLVNEYNYSSLGQWEAASESMSARAASYQAQIAGKSGEIFRLNGVKFDGFKNGVLLEAKGPGYANFIENGQFRTWFQCARGLVEQARRQFIAAQGIPIEWHVAEITVANLIRYILENAGYDTIKVIFTPIP